MVSTATIPAHQLCAEHSRCASNVAGGLPGRVYATLRLGSPDWGVSIALLGGSAYLYGTAAIIRRLPIFVGALIWWPEAGSFIFPALFFAFCSMFPRQLFRTRWTWLANVPALFFLWPIVGFAYFTFVNPAGEITRRTGSRVSVPVFFLPTWAPAWLP